MDPVTAVGLAASIIQFIDIGTKIFSTAKEMRETATGMTSENRRTADIIGEIRNLSAKLENLEKVPQTEDEKALCRLASECRELSQQILKLLEKTTPTDPKLKWHALVSACKSLMSQKEKAELAQKLGQCRDHLALRLNYMLSYDFKKRLKIEVERTETKNTVLCSLQDQLRTPRRGLTLESIGEIALRQVQALMALPEVVQHAMAQLLTRRSLAY
ncbi:hypothetical protein K458DRAFT_87340 [Lentithecium fluviatile CBS 122367]|uniref:Fungal N-terminal domain-containing protein n=1 Tax=Lentithecium fluviatile CBS 122367 TaxID=1168545 RepID=A0A6G1IRH6_9PLEO|nr:hypothetical protein K458DRAFT_87340 [Lentithecium fluviatile CBS 122367]